MVRRSRQPRCELRSWLLNGERLLLRDALLRVGREFSTAREEALTGHPLAQFIRADLPADVRDALGDMSGDFIVEGSPGVGNWAFVPWVSAFDPLVTDTATRGYYVVYLFAHGRPEVHLSLNQGTTAVVNEFGNGAHQVLRDRAALMRAYLMHRACGYPTTSTSSMRTRWNSALTDHYRVATKLVMRSGGGTGWTRCLPRKTFVLISN
jgi:hypothetical protein